MQANHHDATRTAIEIQRRILRAEQFHQLIADDFDDLLAGLDALDNLRANRFAFDTLDEIPRDLEIDVGFEQRQAHLAQ